MIDIDNTYTGTPNIRTDTGFFRYIIKLIISFIYIETAAYLVSGKKNIF